MKWLECAGKSRKKELKKGRDEFENHSNLKRLEEKRYECAILARMEFGTVTRKVRTLSSLSAVAYS